MNIENIIAEYDKMFGKYSLTDIENYLSKHLMDAKMSGENEAQITLLNEIIGLCRDTSQREKALSYCGELKSLLQSMSLKGTIAYATSLLNIANAYRAFGMLQDSINLYEEVYLIYKDNVSETDFVYASLYNNWSLVYQEAGDFYKSIELLKKALDIAVNVKESDIPQATTRVNLAGALLQTGAYDEALAHLRKAIEIFENDGKKDFHYSAALVTMGDICAYKSNYEDALKYYEEGLNQIEKHTGINANYEKVQKKIINAKNKISNWEGNLQKSKDFYEKYGKAMIHKLFPDYENRIAVGMVGEGSDCFGFDDEISMDHDYSVGFCMWLTDEDYEKIGQPLQMAYDELIKTVYQFKSIDRFLDGRRGAIRINDFYNNILRTRYHFTDNWQPDYYELEEMALAAATNGEVFRDDLGVFSNIRYKLLDYYPDDLWIKKVAQEVHEFSQYAQSNYPRMMARGDQLTANLCINKAIESALNLVFLLNKTYAPYYKWKRKGVEQFRCSKRLVSILDEISMLTSQKSAWTNIKYSPIYLNDKDRVVVLFEEAASIILKALKNRDLVSGDNLFLESHVYEILSKCRGNK